MSTRNPIADLDTHQVTNQPAPLENFNAFDTDRALREGSSAKRIPLVKMRPEGSVKRSANRSAVTAISRIGIRRSCKPVSGTGTVD